MIYPIPQGLDAFEEHELVKLNKRGIATPEQKNLLAAYATVKFLHPEEDTVSKCVYIGSNTDSYLLDGGFKDYVRVPKRPTEAKYLDKLTTGQETDIYIDFFNETPYLIEGSISSLKESQAHDALLNSGSPVEGTVRDLTPAGYLVDINVNGVELAGFLPNTHAGVNKLLDPESILNQTLLFMVESYSYDEGTYVLSRRKYLQTLISDAVKELEFNKVYTGVITGTTNYGVFVEFNEILTGMIHKTAMGADWQDRLQEIPAGTMIDFYVKEILKNNKIILTQELKETLWDELLVDDIIEGTVKSVRDFGILVSLDEDTIGLIPHTEVNRKKIIVNNGDTINVKVLNINRSDRKILLSAMTNRK